MSDVHKSRQIFSALRPGNGLRTDKDGFVTMSDLLRHERLIPLKMTKAEVLSIAADCPLQRFEVKTKCRTALIRTSPRKAA